MGTYECLHFLDFMELKYGLETNMGNANLLAHICDTKKTCMGDFFLVLDFI